MCKGNKNRKRSSKGNYRWIQTQTIIVNKTPVVTNIVHPEINRITVKYENIEKNFDSKTLYNQYKDNIGTEIDAVLVTTYFDNGTKKQKLEIEGDE